MAGKLNRLIALLPTDGTPITAKALALSLSVSIRSVKQYVAILGVKFPGLIVSTSKGYCLSADPPTGVETSTGFIPETSDERAEQAILLLLNDNPGVWDLPDLAESLYVSVETVRKDLAIIRSRLQEYDLAIEIHNGVIYINGPEISKRHLLSELLFLNYDRNVLSMAAIQGSFRNYDVSKIKKIVLDSCSKNNYFINGYAIDLLVLDMMIAIDRMSSFQLASNVASNMSTAMDGVLKLADEVTSRIEEASGVSFNSVEVNETAQLLSCYVIGMDKGILPANDMHQVVDQRSWDLVEQMKDEVSCFDILDYNNSELMARFYLHIQNLLFRLENGYVARNPLTNRIRTTCPMIFEYAVEVSNHIYENSGLHVSEHEVTNIALLIGNILETQHRLRDKISCIIYQPDYYDMGMKIANQLAEMFESQLVIRGIVTMEDELSKFDNVELLITTVPIDPIPHMNTLLLSPFISERDIGVVRNKIDAIVREQNQANLREKLLSISSAQYFERNVELYHDEDVINHIADRLLDGSIVEAEFGHEVMKRERSYSTAYGMVAVPHAFKMHAKKTMIYVILNEKPIQWGNGKVNIVLMFAINAADRLVFYEVFDHLVVLLLDPNTVKKVVECKDYQSFVDTLLRCY